MSVLETKIDELYRAPLNDFTSARNALAKTLAGDDAKRVRTLAKPTLVPWAVNQVYWRARAAYDRLMKAGERLRKAQIAALEGRAADVRGASEAHRQAISDAVGEAERIAASAGSKPGTDALARAFEALSVATELPEPPGRFTQALRPAGFEALAGVKPQPAEAKSPVAALRALQARGGAGHEKGGPRPTNSAPPPPERDAKADRARRAAEAREAAALRERQSAVKQAEAKVARAEAAEQQARAVWEKAHDTLLEARRELWSLKAAT